MKKFVFVLALVAFVSTVSATAIAQEDVTIDLSNSEVDVRLDIDELTSESLTYVVSYPVYDLESRINGEQVECDVRDLQIGSEIQCPTDISTNFTASFDFRTSGITSSRENVDFFQFTRVFRVPTDHYRLKVVLPENSVIVNDENLSQPAFSPSYGETGSDGQRIFVIWETDPALGGEPISFSVFYNDSSSDDSLIRYIGIGLLIILLSILGLAVWKRISSQNISEVYSELTEDQREVVDLLIENEGSMLQKDVVDESEYSKAKVSGVVSELVDQGIIQKEKEGRSNKLRISGRFRF